jgi:Fe2+ transport system protein FeoA
MRLLNIGLRVGDEVEVISNLGMGQVVVASKDNRYVLGKEMSEEIMVEHVKKELK